MERSKTPLPERTTGPGGTAAVPAKEGASNRHDPKAREARVEELRQQVLNETYEIDATKLSAKIVERHLKK